MSDDKLFDIEVVFIDGELYTFRRVTTCDVDRLSTALNHDKSWAFSKTDDSGKLSVANIVNTRHIKYMTVNELKGSPCLEM